MVQYVQICFVFFRSRTQCVFFCYTLLETGNRKLTFFLSYACTTFLRVNTHIYVHAWNTLRILNDEALFATTNFWMNCCCICTTSRVFCIHTRKYTTTIITGCLAASTTIRARRSSPHQLPFIYTYSTINNNTEASARHCVECNPSMLNRHTLAASEGVREISLVLRLYTYLVLTHACVP